MNIYDQDQNIILGPVPITPVNKIDTGIYEYLYVIPGREDSLNNRTILSYEFIGNPEGLPAITRGIIQVSNI